jgi:hypothetical protein
MFAANEVGYRVGRRSSQRESEQSRAVSGSLKSSVIGLVALLLGFTFAMTTSRFNERQHLVLDEANAVGTCYLRAGVLSEPQREKIRSTLVNYTDARLEFFRTALNHADYDRTTKAMDTAITELWSHVELAVKVEPEMVRLSQIIPAANSVIDLNTTRAWEGRNRTPVPVIILLAVCAVVSSGLMGHSSGQTRFRHLGLWLALNVLIVLVIYVVLDFDRSRRGLIQVDHTALEETRTSMTVISEE